ncbi:UDP-N-acetylmuramate--alanine ligase [Sphingomonas melonis TY]|jgi:UDP-N-acetylmuramate--alanine ligase|nr:MULTISPECIES: Mur ligase family protein [Sphingomonas]ATI55353.1 UDP-N-acetylmuramate--alanine ligase [Sphingomonas melonis]KZB95257.1 UDP-N-acetylmuramate--alanine ligase [Sphingomonas melonis TY]MBI0531452.1 UDP-N-acetylmuramate--alanine ligase [Sphingomonas sp. TX0522]MBX8843813.1 UDP-N-acetylmuramate--alanine ligase [Sphingomonas melonis]MBX8853435.1 UDP-N-acetylmuramate--alanine ligase [Sphingomonas melonis]
MANGNISETVQGQRFFLVGIGGSGMLPLATILAGRGAIVEGSDRGLDQGRVPAKFDSLIARGIRLHPQDGSGIVSGEQIVVASAAVEDTVADIVAATRLGCARMSRAELLSALFNASDLPIGIAGTSGKSTVTGMIGWILHAMGRDPTVMNGAVMKNFAAPDAPFASALVGANRKEGGDAFVSEVDESDGSIARYVPRVAVLNNVSLDHKALDELRRLFADFAGKAEVVIANVGDAETAALVAGMANVVRVAVEAEADLRAENLVPEPFAIGFDLVIATPSPFGRFAPSSLSRWKREGAPEARKGEGETRLRVQLAVPGRHNVANALAAIAAVVAAGIPPEQAVEAIGGFTGLRRRFDFVGAAGGVAVIDDFGHNPDKIAATLDTLHAFPGRLRILFQPHGYGPLKVMRRELVESLTQRLRPDDLLVLPDPVYHGGTVNREVTSADIVADLTAAGRDARHVANRAEAAALLVAEARPGDRIVVMGARDDTLSLLAAEMLESLRARG